MLCLHLGQRSASRPRASESFMEAARNRCQSPGSNSGGLWEWPQATSPLQLSVSSQVKRERKVNWDHCSQPVALGYMLPSPHSTVHSLAPCAEQGLSHHLREGLVCFAPGPTEMKQEEAETGTIMRPAPFPKVELRTLSSYYPELWLHIWAACLTPPEHRTSVGRSVLSSPVVVPWVILRPCHSRRVGL